MSIEHRIFNTFNNQPLLDYRYDGKAQTFHTLVQLPIQYQHQDFQNEHDLITDWSNAARDVLADLHAESETKLWEGHIEQFGRVMLELAKLCDDSINNKSSLVASLRSLLPEFDGNDASFYFVYSGSAQLVFCRAWFSLLAHPLFINEHLNAGWMGFDFLYFQLLVDLAAQNLNDKLKKKSKSI